MLNSPETQSSPTNLRISSGPFGVRMWTLLCALLGATGWLLSALNCLGATGYFLALVVIGGIMFWVFRDCRPDWNPKRWKRRFKRPFAAGFLILAGLSVLGGTLYAPVFFDGMAYRTTRVLNWLAEGHWWWIPDYRGWLNTRSTAYEWVTAPVLALLKTDRCLFLINIVSFLLLPGLGFSFLTRCGVGRRAAWYWMWLLPTGYGYLLQSGSIGNDLFGSVFAMAAVDFALRARETKRVSDLMFSFLAAALMIGAKFSNLPLLLPWYLFAMPSWRLLFKDAKLSLPVLVLAIFCSFLPVGFNNYRHCGDWTGQAAENAFSSKDTPAVFVTHGAILLAAQNLTPPVLPLAGRAESAINHALPERLITWWSHDEPYPGWNRIGLREMVAEEDAGWGFGLSVVVLTQFIVGGWRKLSLKTTWAQLKTWSGFWRAAVLLSPLVSLVFFLSKSGLTTVARTIIPYYALLLPLCFIISGVDVQVRSRWWKVLGLCVFLVAGLAVVVIPERPLWPALTVLKKLGAHMQSPALGRAVRVYETYRERSEVLSPLIEALPQGTEAVGLICVTEPEASLWRPFGSRRIFHVIAETKPDELAARGIEWVIVNVATSPAVLKQPLADWMSHFNAYMEKSISIRVFASEEPIKYQLVRIAPDKAPGATPEKATQ